jgi:polysaccharide biosynthesis/export protein
MVKHRTLLSILRASLLSSLVAGCGTAQLQNSGPSASRIEATSQRISIALVELTPALARQLAHQPDAGFGSFVGQPAPVLVIGAGDQIEVTLWEAAPSLLFGGLTEQVGGTAAPRATTLPAQTVAGDGAITVPFAGRIAAAGRTPREVEQAIVAGLDGQAHRPQALVRVIKATALDVTVVGEVAASVRMPLTPRGERLLDAIAAAGGVRQPVEKATLQVVRNGQARAVPLEVVIRDPQQNVVLRPGDIVTAYYQPLAFTALGAVAKNGEIPFEATGLTLAQALGRVGGVLDHRADASGVFLFRNENDAPVIYRLNLLQPEAFLAMREFRMHDKDVLYVSNAPLADLQKVMSLVATMLYPVTITTH